MQKSKLAALDFTKAGKQYRVWLHLGLLEVKQRYRRSVLGPWWISISLLIFIVAMGVIFSRLFGQSLAEYIPFFTTGFLLWSFIANSINEATDLFKMNNGFIKQIDLPYNLYVLKFFTRNVIILAHNFAVYFLVIVFFTLNPGWVGLLAIPALMLLFINLYWICMLVAIISTRFRDMVPIVNSCMQMLFFITPVSWMPKLLGENSIIIKLNPFVYFLEIVRQPLLGIVPPLHIWVMNVCIACVGAILTFRLFSAIRTRIPFWVD